MDEVYDQTREEEIQSFKSHGLTKVIEQGTCLEDSQKMISFINKYDCVYGAVGYHPNYTQDINEEHIACLRDYANDKKIVAIGEIGLDYYRKFSDKEKQKEIFKLQIEMAHNLSLPVILHVRDSYKDTLDILIEMKKYLKNGICLHCYSGSKELVHNFSKLDCYFSFGGVVTFKNSKKEEVIRAVPQDRILSETDSPYLTPTPYRGTVNNPKYVKFVVEKLAEVRELTNAEMEKTLYKNAHAIFSKLNN